ncbi:YhbY family RNA-binding protein [Erysipelothrix sp. HDW6C]|uniref:YhbY family RNA-binding protein n=1 Tax=Erysipelothrix sp. HDW6C TaxID=2714930 RepID=UPI001408891B|nr:YhbY family RNA-binding protein [Erysipelothrix sp. HDW6C]QIK70126.1 YhbY family RNA-binding protein [Erysipelothrix sp. HDW6C]
MLNKDQLKELRRLSHHENALVSVGKNGLTPTLLESFEASLLAHNLVKVSIQKNSETTKEALIAEIEDRFGAYTISKVGRVVVFYRYNAKGRIKV